MTRLIKLVALSAFLLPVFVSAASAQSPYPSLEFAREPNTQGTMDYVLKPVVDELQKKLGGDDKPYQIVGVVARPANKSAVLLLVNGQKELQFLPEGDTSAVITVDSVELPRLKYELAATNDKHVIKLQIANVLISLSDLQRIAKGSSVALKFGPVTHKMDKENLSAFRYLTSEIEKDLTK